jgi:hypothetical protein
MWGDSGCGESVRLGKYRDGHYPDDLLTACATMVREWAPNPAPQWVTSIPNFVVFEDNGESVVKSIISSTPSTKPSQLRCSVAADVSQLKLRLEKIRADSRRLLPGQAKCRSDKPGGLVVDYLGMEFIGLCGGLPGALLCGKRRRKAAGFRLWPPNSGLLLRVSERGVWRGSRRRVLACGVRLVSVVRASACV